MAVRYPRGSGGVAPLAVARRPAVRQGRDPPRAQPGEADGKASRIAILAFGTLLYPALEVGEAIGCHRGQHALGQAHRRSLLREVAERHDALVTVERAPSWAVRAVR